MSFLISSLDSSLRPFFSWIVLSDWFLAIAKGCGPGLFGELYESSSSEESFSPASWRLQCFESYAFCLKAFPQSLHLKGLCPEWILRWSFKLQRLSNSRLQTPQTRRELSLWVIWLTTFLLMHSTPSTIIFIYEACACWYSCINLMVVRMFGFWGGIFLRVPSIIGEEIASVWERTLPFY